MGRVLAVVFGLFVLLGSALSIAGAVSSPRPPIPPAKAAYVGEWRSPTMTLVITPDGEVAYERVRGATRTSFRGPIRRFEGDHFVVGIPIFSATFVVSRPPREDAGEWTMVVDGMELTRE